ncbi:conserved hypothetical protein [Arthrobacter sp. 9AX]|nr:conserved hypothetical protein [Arthrobacter sp. 9AX]
MRSRAPCLQRRLFLNRTGAHHGSVGTKGICQRLGLALCLLIPPGATSGCSYDYPEPSPPPAANPVPETASVQVHSDPLVLEREAKNYAELDRLLETSPGPVLLSDKGPLDGPFRGFGKAANVPATGAYTVTAACVGASGATVAVGQEHPGEPFRPTELVLDCGGPTSQVITLDQGYVFAHLLLTAPGDTPWTGAVGGVRVTGGS